MRALFALTLVLGLLFTLGCGKTTPTATAPPPALDGDYRMTKMWIIDKWIEPKADLFMTIKGESMTSGGGCLGVGTNPIKFDASKTPAEIDWMLPGEGDEKALRTTRGIYKFDGDELTLVFAPQDDAPRPTDFTPHEKVLVVVAKRK